MFDRAGVRSSTLSQQPRNKVKEGCRVPPVSVSLPYRIVTSGSSMIGAAETGLANGLRRDRDNL